MEDVQFFLSPFHSLHLFQLFQADCVYKKSLEDACYFLLQSVSLVFYSFSLFQLFQWNMSNFFKSVSFVTLVSAVSGRFVYKKSLEHACYLLLQSVSLVFYSFSLFQLFQWNMSNFFKSVSFVTLVSAVSGRFVYKKSLEHACYLLLQSVSLVFYSFSLFQLFQWKMSNFFKPVSFVTLVSAVSGRLCL